ncbi:MAG: acyl carrier protein [Clostridia bacterium]|nr:acyl carrier protein [Clostridia bacterium]
MIFERIREIIGEQLQILPEEIEIDMRLDELGIDSLDLFQIVMVLEELYGIEIDSDVADGFVTIEDVVNYIENNK